MGKILLGTYNKGVILIKKIVNKILFIGLAIVLLASCSNNTNDSDAVSEATKIRYSESEIQDYKGIKLDPSVGPRDNSINGIQNVDINKYELKISGLVKHPISLTYDDVLNLPSYQKLITLHCVEGWDATILWEGAKLEDIISLGQSEMNANTVIFHCVDGYTTSLPLKTIIDKEIIIAYYSNKITLPTALGYPFIVVAEDKLGYKWARWVNEIELTDNANYKGYWERKGYSNEADVPEDATR